jgi:hypothetical protein
MNTGDGGGVVAARNLTEYIQLHNGVDRISGNIDYAECLFNYFVFAQIDLSVLTEVHNCTAVYATILITDHRTNNTAQALAMHVQFDEHTCLVVSEFYFFDTAAGPNSIFGPLAGIQSDCTYNYPYSPDDDDQPSVDVDVLSQIRQSHCHPHHHGSSPRKHHHHHSGIPGSTPSLLHVFIVVVVAALVSSIDAPLAQGAY